MGIVNEYIKNEPKYNIGYTSESPAEPAEQATIHNKADLSAGFRVVARYE